MEKRNHKSNDILIDVFYIGFCLSLFLSIEKWGEVDF